MIFHLQMTSQYYPPKISRPLTAKSTSPPTRSDAVTNTSPSMELNSVHNTLKELVKNCRCLNNRPWTTEDPPEVIYTQGVEPLPPSPPRQLPATHAEHFIGLHRHQADHVVYHVTRTGEPQTTSSIYHELLREARGNACPPGDPPREQHPRGERQASA